MMIVRTIFVTAVVIATGFAGTSTSVAESLVSDAFASQAGLKVEWSTQVNVGAAGRVVDWQLDIDENQSTTYFVVTSGKRREVISQHDIDAFGKPYGIEGAKTFAGIRQEIFKRENEVRGSEAKVEITSYALPKSSIYVLNDSSEVISLDADTGKVRWLQAVGDPRLPSAGLGASHDYVAVANGSMVYCLSAETGSVLWSKQCQFAIGASPTCSDKYVFVPLSNGRLETFPIESDGYGAVAFVGNGTSTARPLITESTISWPTDIGDLNVAPRDNRNSTSYRLKTNDAILATPSYLDGAIFSGSLDGYVYAIDEAKGRMLWEVTVGDGVTSTPVPFGQFIYIVTRGNQLYKIEAKTGRYAENWQKPVSGIRQFVGVAKNQFYCLSTAGELVGMDRKTGSVISSVPAGVVDLVLPNRITDRMFLGSHTGYIQCIRPIDSLRPQMMGGDLDMVNEQEMAADGPEPDDDATEEPAAEMNPFGGSPAADSNPFGSSEENPFGGGGGDVNPFGGSGDAEDSPADEADDEDVNPFG